MGTVWAPVSPSDSRSTLFIGTNVMLPGSPTGMVPVYAEPPASETPWIDWTCPACVKRSVVAVVAQLIPMLPWLPSWSSWICPVPSSKPCVGNPAIVPSAFWIWGMTWKTERGGDSFEHADHLCRSALIYMFFFVHLFFFTWYWMPDTPFAAASLPVAVTYMGWLGILPIGSTYCPLDVIIPEFGMWTTPWSSFPADTGVNTSHRSEPVSWMADISVVWEHNQKSH